MAHSTPDTLVLDIAVRRAEATIKTQWKVVSKHYTMGWMGPIDVFEAQYPHISHKIADIKNNISHDLPIVIFLSREFSPKSMIAAIPHKSIDGNPYNSRLVLNGVVATTQLSKEKVHLLSNFSQAFWFLIDNQLLPNPQNGDKLEKKIIEWCGKNLIQL